MSPSRYDEPMRYYDDGLDFLDVTPDLELDPRDGLWKPLGRPLESLVDSRTTQGSIEPPRAVVASWRGLGVPPLG